MKTGKLLRPLLIGGGIGLLAAAGFALGMFGQIMQRVDDRLFLSHPADPAIVIVSIDNASLSQIGRWPWPRDTHAKIIDRLTTAGARAIGYDVNFSEVSDAALDTELAQAIARSGKTVLPVELEFIASGGRLTFDPKKTVSPLPELGAHAAATGHVNTPPDADGVVRRVPLVARAPDGSLVPCFACEILRVAGRDSQLTNAPLDGNKALIVNYPDAPGKAFRVISAVDVLHGTADLRPVKGAMVLVGATASDLHDENLSPTSQGRPMPGVEIHASLADTILHGRWLRALPTWVGALYLVLLGLVIGLAVPRLRARYGLILVGGLLVASVVLGIGLFDQGWIFDLVWPAITIILAYAAVTLERRIASERERRQIRQAFSRYVSSTVVDAILEDPSRLKLGGERKRMSVLFSDIRGFTTISEGLSPERLVEILNKYLNRMTDVVFANHGVLDKYIGDAVMAFWNAPFDQPEHALCAAMTALEMRSALRQMNTEHAFGAIELKIGIGINTGDMVVGNVGGDTRFDYTVIGDNVNMASRLEGLNKEYGTMILATEAASLEIQDRILMRKIDKVAVKGKKEPVVICEIMEDAERATALQKALKERFELALEKYWSRDFASAITICDEILKHFPDDGPSKLLKERAALFIQTAPPAAWDGTWVYLKK